MPIFHFQTIPAPFPHIQHQSQRCKQEEKHQWRSSRPWWQLLFTQKIKSKEKSMLKLVSTESQRCAGLVLVCAVFVLVRQTWFQTIGVVLAPERSYPCIQNVGIIDIESIVASVRHSKFFAQSQLGFASRIEQRGGAMSRLHRCNWQTTSVFWWISYAKALWWKL